MFYKFSVQLLNATEICISLFDVDSSIIERILGFNE